MVTSLVPSPSRRLIQLHNSACSPSFFFSSSHSPGSLLLSQSCTSSVCSQFSSQLVCSCSALNTNAEDEKKQFKDTRIHWKSPDEGWFCVDESPTEPELPSDDNEDSVSARPRRNGTLMGLLSYASDSHYRYLELTPDAEPEDVKAAYRRLSKTYHPDTTSLPLEVAAEKFVRLTEAYNVLSDEQERRFYDWTLAQKISKQQGGRFIWPYEAGMAVEEQGSNTPKMWEDDELKAPVDRLGGRNMELSDQAQTALLFDAFAVLVSICTIIYAVFFKQQT